MTSTNEIICSSLGQILIFQQRQVAINDETLFIFEQIPPIFATSCLQKRKEILPLLANSW